MGTMWKLFLILLTVAAANLAARTLFADSSGGNSPRRPLQAGAMSASNNLSDLTSPPTARANIGIGKGADVASAGTITPSTSAAFFHVTGTTAIDFITKTSFEDGVQVCFYYVSAIVLHNNTGAPPVTTYPLQLIGGADASLAAGAYDCFRLDVALTKWKETERSAP